MGGRKYSHRKEQIHEMFDNIIKGSDKIRNIVNELRDYAREQPLDSTETIQINNVVKSALALLNNLILKSTEKFQVSFGKDIPLINGDYQRLEQVLINVIQNGCQALQNKDKAITVRTYHDPSRHAVIVEITDEGIGISEEDLKHIKDPFFTTKRSSGGTGLGLSISASIIEKHKGTLDFESKPGKGTAVTIVLPERE